MDEKLERKLKNLRSRIRRLDSALVAFSGGVDSSFLMRICREELGEKAIAVTALSKNYPRSELSLARRVAKIIGVKHLVLTLIPGEGSEVPLSSSRTSNVYSSLKSLAMRMKMRHVLVGSHRCDMDEKSRTLEAARNANVRTPLLESNLSKAEIRLLAKELGLPNWDKRSSGPKKKRRKRLESAKRYLDSLGLGADVTARGGKAVITANKTAMLAIVKNFEKIGKKMRMLGFSGVLLRMR